VVLDGITGNYDIGAMFRLCDAFLVEQLVICGTTVQLHREQLVPVLGGPQHAHDGC
jgi:tRNA G18 (ribose-2'-O)-methylase SpoU